MCVSTLTVEAGNLAIAMDDYKLLSKQDKTRQDCTYQLRLKPATFHKRTIRVNCIRLRKSEMALQIKLMFIDLHYRFDKNFWIEG